MEPSCVARYVVETRVARLAVETRFARLAVETRFARFAVETRFTKLAVLTSEPRTTVERYPAVPKPITVLVSCVAR